MRDEMARVHTVATFALIALVPLVPLGFWIYARAASVDRGPEVRHAKLLLSQTAPPLAGARNLGFDAYEERSWAGENLVPISSYTVETAYRLPHAMRPSEVVVHYKRELTDWRIEEASAAGVAFRRGDDRIALDIAEYRDSPTSMREYGVMVSH